MAIHPGYGFSPKMPIFAERGLRRAGFIFVGPKPETIRLEENRRYRGHAAAGVPCVPGSGFDRLQMRKAYPAALPGRHWLPGDYQSLAVVAAAACAWYSILHRSMPSKTNPRRSRATFGNDTVYME